MTREEDQMLAIAQAGMTKILVEGLRERSGRTLNDWIQLPASAHMLKAQGHLVSAEKMRQGFAPEDSEGIQGHMFRAMTRIAMALWQEKFQ